MSIAPTPPATGLGVIAHAGNARVTSVQQPVELLSARWVLPVDGPPILDGAIAHAGGRIVAVGPADALRRCWPSAPHRSYERAIAIPGLVNAHVHVAHANARPPVGLAFAAWIEHMADRVRRSASEPHGALEEARGAAWALVRGGVTTVGDSGPHAEAAIAIAESGLGGRFYLEAFGPNTRDTDDAAQRAERGLDRVGAIAPGVLLGLAPHAPYTVSAALYRAVEALARRRLLPLTTHLAESREEVAFVAEGSGPLAERLRVRGIAVDANACSPVAWLARLGLLDDGPPLLLAHLVQVDAADVELLASSRRSLAGVLCPTSNQALGVGLPPAAQLLAAGVTLALGTDSAASSPRQDLFDEMRLAARLQLTHASALRAATLGGARALGLERSIGSLSPGKQADVAVVAIPGVEPLERLDPWEAVVARGSADAVVLTVLRGHVVSQREAPRGVSIQQEL